MLPSLSLVAATGTEAFYSLLLSRKSTPVLFSTAAAAAAAAAPTCSIAMSNPYLASNISGIIIDLLFRQLLNMFI
jgi:hypothetical protein